MPKKIDNYDKERNELLERLLNILEIDEINNTLSINKIDKDIDKQNKILDLELEIKKYFYYSQWSCFKSTFKPKRRWLSIIKNLMKAMNYKIEPYYFRNRKVECDIDTIYRITKR